MESYELDDLVRELEAVSAFLSQLAANEDEISMLGFGAIKEWDSYTKALPVLEGFDSRMVDLLELARAVDRNTWTAITNVVGNGQVGEAIGKIFVRLQVEVRRKRVTSGSMYKLLRYSMRMIVQLPERQVFVDQEMPVHQVLVALYRLTPLVKRVHQEYWRQRRLDDQLFKPSNIDPTIVIEYIENAIVNIQVAPLNEVDRKILLEYLLETKVQLSSSNCSWRQVVGALVVISTLIGGAGELPAAAENVKNAINYILGHSISKEPPPQLPQYVPVSPMIADGIGGSNVGSSDVAF